RIYNPAGFVSFKVVQLALDKAKGEKVRLERAAPEGAGVENTGAAPSAVERVSDPVLTDEVAELVEHLQATKLAMSQLSERQRVAFVKCQLEGRSQTEVAQELSEPGKRPISRKAVERLVANARVSLSVAFSKVASGAFCEEQRKLLELVEKGWATPEQEAQAHTHLEDCSHCAQVRAFERFERDAGLAAITLPGFGVTHATGAGAGLLGSAQHLAGAVGERARELAMRAWPFGDGTEAGGAAMGTVTTTKAIVAICIAAGGAGACVKAIAPKHHDPKPVVHEQKHQPAPPQAVATVTAEPAPAGEVLAASSSSAEEARKAAAARAAKQQRARQRAARSAKASSPASSTASTAAPAQQEFGFEGGSSSSGSGSSGASSSSPAVSSSSASSGSSSTQAPAPSPAPTSGGSGGGGSGGGGSQSQQEFGLGQ
ncbi:MAG TPA: sigma factor-like helix-turn-helix DNA-binding protein, partial [Solirubrobacterales bacterium]|nr:sigma factor-like helix-turn-helix DNA-binding protein [Solirubrobacterales bacterium]